MWREYCNTSAVNGAGMRNDQTGSPSAYHVWHFCDNKKDADELADLVLRGEKRATASLHSLYELDKELVPKPGDISIVTDFEGRARCVIKTTAVTITPFNRVPESFALREGEGDKSLWYWREAHRRAFSRELEALGLSFSEDLLVVCEEFDMVFP